MVDYDLISSLVNINNVKTKYVTLTQYSNPISSQKNER